MRDARARKFFEKIWRRGDSWKLESSAFEQAKYNRQLELLGGARWRRVLEIGCGAGAFTGRLAMVADYVLALDVAPSAIARAQKTTPANRSVEFSVEDVMVSDLDAEGRWDLVVMSETVYYLGWLHTFFEVGWLAGRIFDATTPGGKFMMTNTFGDDEQLPWILRTYRDLFRNVGYRLETEELFRGEKDGVAQESLVSLFVRPEDSCATWKIANSFE